MNCFGWVSKGQFTQGLVGGDSSAWEEEWSRTVAFKQLQFVSFSWGCGRKRHLGRLWAVTIEGRAHPWQADKGREGPGAEGLIDSQCRGFNTGKSTVVLGQGV